VNWWASSSQEPWWDQPQLEIDGGKERHKKMPGSKRRYHDLLTGASVIMGLCSRFSKERYRPSEDWENSTDQNRRKDRVKKGSNLKG